MSTTDRLTDKYDHLPEILTVRQEWDQTFAPYCKDTLPVIGGSGTLAYWFSQNIVLAVAGGVMAGAAAISPLIYRRLSLSGAPLSRTEAVRKLEKQEAACLDKTQEVLNSDHEYLRSYKGMKELLRTEFSLFRLAEDLKPSEEITQAGNRLNEQIKQVSEQLYDAYAYVKEGRRSLRKLDRDPRGINLKEAPNDPAERLIWRFKMHALDRADAFIRASHPSAEKLAEAREIKERLSSPAPA